MDDGSSSSSAVTVSETDVVVLLLLLLMSVLLFVCNEESGDCCCCDVVVLLLLLLLYLGPLTEVAGGDDSGDFLSKILPRLVSSSGDPALFVSVKSSSSLNQISSSSSICL